MNFDNKLQTRLYVLIKVDYYLSIATNVVGRIYEDGPELPLQLLLKKWLALLLRENIWKWKFITIPWTHYLIEMQNPNVYLEPENIEVPVNLSILYLLIKCTYMFHAW